MTTGSGDTEAFSFSKVVVDPQLVQFGAEYVYILPVRSLERLSFHSIPRNKVHKHRKARCDVTQGHYILVAHVEVFDQHIFKGEALVLVFLELLEVKSLL